MDRLSEVIQSEKDHAKFMAAVQQLLDLIRAKQQRIDPASTADEQTEGKTAE